MTFVISTGLYLRTFGGRLDAHVDGEPIAPKRAKKAKLLLALLAAHHHHDISREWVVARQWPDSDPISGAHNLRQTLSDLRQSLGTEAARIVGDGRNLRLDVVGADIDVVSFDKAIAKSDPECLRQAIEIYDGPFLEGIDEPWIIAEREPRHRAVLSALDKLACSALAEGDVEEAIAYRRKAVALAPLDEPILRNLMTDLRSSGDHAGMVDALRAFEKLLAKEDPFARPSGETMELVRETRAPSASKPSRPFAELPERPPMPAPLTELIGREEDLTEISALVARKRLITLTGPGGVGKTRLALAVAHAVENDFHNGAVFVDLAAIIDPELIPTAVASSLQLVDSLGRIAAASVIEHLRDADMLIVFDNCEHVIQRTAEFVQMLLGRCHRVRVLATSREPLLFPGERVWSVPTLAFPDEGVREISDIVRYPAVRLFVERAEDVSDQFSINARNADDIVSLCRRLDGIPLALELAAVMVSSMDIGPLVSALDQRFSLLTSGNRTTLPRHRTLRGVVDWGYELLAEPERLLLRRLAVFTGAWMLEDAAVVCTGPGDVTDIGPEDVKDLLPHLVRKSFVVFEAATQTHRLLETIRQYALEKLDATGELVDLRNRHMHHYYRRIQDTGGDIEPIRGLVSVLTNIRAAMDWSIDAAEADVAVDFCKFIAWFASSSHLQAEGSARFETLLRRSDFDGPSRHRMHSLQILGWFSTKQADIVAARKYFAECVDVCHTIGELDFIPTVLTGRVETEIVAGDLPAALKFACECLEITPTTTEKYGLITTQVGALYEMNGDADSAVDMLTRSLQFWESFDPKHDFKNLTTIQLASAYSRMGRLDEARHIIGAYLTDAMAVNYGYYGVDAVLVGIRITYAMGRTERAAATVSMLIHFASELGWLKSWELRPDFDELRKTVMSGLSDRQLAAIDAEAVCTDWHSICAAVIKEIA